MRYNIQAKRCRCCIMPETPGHVEMDETGVCSLCRAFRQTEAQQETFEQFSPEKKLAILQKKVDRYKNKGEYDCVVAVSGGKDSIMTLYIAVRTLGLKPLAVFIDNGFALEEMYQNVRNATDILGADLLIYKTADMLRLFPRLLRSGRRLYYCRICHALLDRAVLSICQKYGIGLSLGGYTKGQQYLRNSELFWIYDESDRNICELLDGDPDFGHLLPMYQNQQRYFTEHFGRIRQISPFKYVEWNEDEILALITRELKWQKPKRSWPDKSSNCAFNYVAQYLAEKQFGYAQHESELSVQVRSGELTRARAEEIIESPIEESDLVSALQKLGLTLNDIL